MSNHTEHGEANENGVSYDYGFCSAPLVAFCDQYLWIGTAISFVATVYLSRIEAEDREAFAALIFGILSGIGDIVLQTLGLFCSGGTASKIASVVIFVVFKIGTVACRERAGVAQERRHPKTA